MTFLDRVTRRRLVLGVLLVASLALLTGYFREPDAGPLHASQRAFASAAAPFETAVQRVAQPFRDAWSWSRDLVHAKTERDRLAAENQKLLAQLAVALQTKQDTAELRSELHFVNDPRSRPGLRGYRVRGADVIERSPLLTNSLVEINAGASAGVRRFDPVITGAGFVVGLVTAVSRNVSQVTLINDPSSAVGAQIPARNAAGILTPSAGDPGVLDLGFVRKERAVAIGDLVTTSGFNDPGQKLRSHYPRGLPIGQVSNVGQTESDNYKEIQVIPKADLASFATVLVLIPKTAAARR